MNVEKGARRAIVGGCVLMVSTMLVLRWWWIASLVIVAGVAWSLGRAAMRNELEAAANRRAVLRRLREIRVGGVSANGAGAVQVVRPQQVEANGGGA